MQNSVFGGYGASMAFAGMNQQQRNPLSTALDRERMASPAGSGMGGKESSPVQISSTLTNPVIPSSRSPNSQGQNGNVGQEKLVRDILCARYLK
jgi:hypothetical protein